MNVVNMVAPEGAVDLLAERYRISLDKTKGGRELWVEGTLELVVVVAEARSQYHHTIDYGRWLERNGLRAISMQDLSAFNQFAKNLTYARQLLEQSRSWSWREVWSKRPDKPKRPANGAPSGSGKGPISRTLHNASGARKRKRSNVIPTVMRDDYEPGSVMRALAANPAAPLVKRGRRRRGLANDPPVTRLKVGKLVGLTLISLGRLCNSPRNTVMSRCTQSNRSKRTSGRRRCRRGLAWWGSTARPPARC